MNLSSIVYYVLIRDEGLDSLRRSLFLYNKYKNLEYSISVGLKTTMISNNAYEFIDTDNILGNHSLILQNSRADALICQN